MSFSLELRVLAGPKSPHTIFCFHPCPLHLTLSTVTGNDRGQPVFDCENDVGGTVAEPRQSKQRSVFR